MFVVVIPRLNLKDCLLIFQAKWFPNDDGSIVIDFSLELPLFPRRGSGWAQPPEAFCRQVNIHRYAPYMSAYNRNRFHVEFGSETEFDVFLRELVVIPGLECIDNATRYRLEVTHGRLHDPHMVAAAIAQLVQRSFYPDTELNFSIADPACTSARSRDDLQTDGDA